MASVNVVEEIVDGMIRFSFFKDGSSESAVVAEFGLGMKREQIDTQVANIKSQLEAE